MCGGVRLRRTLPYAVRITEPGAIRVFLKLKQGLLLAAAPASGTARVLDRVRDVYPGMSEARHVLQTSLQNGNPVIHPAVSLLNAARIERTRGAFKFYEEGVTPAVGRLVSVLMNRDYLAEAPRTMETLGLAGYDAAGLMRLLG